MIGRLLRSRGARKLRRDRLALAALVVIALYLGLAAAVGLAGLVTRQEAFARVGPDQLVGCWQRPSPAQRIGYVEFWLTRIERALESRAPEQALAEIDLLGLRPVTLVPEALEERLEALLGPFEELCRAIEEERFADAPEGEPRLARLEADARALYGDPPSGLLRGLATALGTDRQGRSILLRALYSIKVAVQVGLVAALVSVLLGSALGGVAAFFGGWLDHLVVWLVSTLSAIPAIVLLMVLAAAFLGSPWEGTLVPVYAAFCATFWIGPCRLIRAEVLKLRELDYVQAATALGFGRLRILSRHVLPNASHLMWVQFSLLFVGAIKAEVILSFLSLGVKNEPSWGVMIHQSRQEVIGGFFWQIGAATGFMFLLVLAFNVLSDALQDAFDPRQA